MEELLIECSSIQSLCKCHLLGSLDLCTGNITSVDHHPKMNVLYIFSGFVLTSRNKGVNNSIVGVRVKHVRGIIAYQLSITLIQCTVVCVDGDIVNRLQTTNGVVFG